MPAVVLLCQGLGLSSPVEDGLRWSAGVAPAYQAPVLWCRRRGDAEAAAPRRPMAVLKLEGCPCIMTSGRARAEVRQKQDSYGPVLVDGYSGH